MRKCELCKLPARLYCESDQASLCAGCDAKVHEANFLVARHSRTLLCKTCQAPTPWEASGARLGNTTTECDQCVVGDRNEGFTDEEVCLSLRLTLAPPPAASSGDDESSSSSLSASSSVCSRGRVLTKRNRECDESASSTTATAATRARPKCTSDSFKNVPKSQRIITQHRRCRSKCSEQP